MTIEEAIRLADETKPNQIDESMKIRWLSDLDRRVFAEILMTHARDVNMPETFDGYRPDEWPNETWTDKSTELLVPAPFDAIYRWYLEMQIDLANMEMDKYNNSAALYDNAWDEFARAWHREHMPVSKGFAWKF